MEAVKNIIEIMEYRIKEENGK